MGGSEGNAVGIAEDPGGGVRQWGFVRGGIGRVTECMADAAREAGATIRTGADVDEILVEGGTAAGVRLASGEVIRVGDVDGLLAAK